MVKNLPANAGDAGDTGSIPGLEIPWRRKWQPTPVFLPENPMDRGAWQATVYRVAMSWAHLSAHTHQLNHICLSCEVLISWLQFIMVVF